MILTLDYDVNNKEIKTNNRASRWGYIIVANNIFLYDCRDRQYYGSDREAFYIAICNFKADTIS